MKVLRRVLAMFAGLLVITAGSLATAQEDVRVVVLDVGAGTPQLESAIGEVPTVEVRDQAWFVEQIRDTGYEPRKIFERPTELRFVMVGSGVDWVVALRADEKRWVGAFFDESGEAKVEFELDRSGDLTAANADTVRAYLESELGIERRQETVEPAVAPETQAEPEVESEPGRNEAADSAVVTADAQESTRAGDRDGAPHLRAQASAALLKRDVTYAGTNSALLTFRSAFYPGAKLEVGYFGIADGIIGVSASVVAGFDQIQGDGDTASVRHLEGELSMHATFGDHASVRLGGRHVRFDLSANDVLPSTHVTLLRLGLHFERSLGPVFVEAAADAYPFGVVGASALFGESALAYGFGGRLAMRYPLGELWGLLAGCDFRTVRTDFTGAGTLDFRDTRAFELVWGPHVGITFAR